MNNDSTITEEQLNSVSELILNTEKQLAEESVYKPAAFSVTFSGGPEGARTQGWVTYTTGEKIYYSGTGRMIYGLPIAMAAGLPIIGTLKSDLLLGAKKVTWRAAGVNRNGLLSIIVDGKPLARVPFVTVGWGIGAWLVEGTGNFRKA